jgi:hypothetical protein
VGCCVQGERVKHEDRRKNGKSEPERGGPVVEIEQTFLLRKRTKKDKIQKKKRVGVERCERDGSVGGTRNNLSISSIDSIRRSPSDTRSNFADARRRSECGEMDVDGQAREERSSRGYRLITGRFVPIEDEAFLSWLSPLVTPRLQFRIHREHPHLEPKPME